MPVFLYWHRSAIVRMNDSYVPQGKMIITTTYYKCSLALHYQQIISDFQCTPGAMRAAIQLTFSDNLSGFAGVPNGILQCSKFFFR